MSGVRGYIFSRPFMGERVPQHVQNIVIRDYCQRNDLRYLLSATEYAMDGCALILEQVLDDLPSLDGIIAYSLFQMPADQRERIKVYDRVLAKQKKLYFAVEGLKLENESDKLRVETIWKVKQAISANGSTPAIKSGVLKHIVTPLHQATKRDYLARMQDQKPTCMVKAKEYGFDYWDGDRRFGYGGYKYLPGRWKPVAEALIKDYHLGPGSKVLDVGCGKGFLLYEMLLLEPKLVVKGFDSSEYGLSHAKEELKPFLFKHKAQEHYPFADKEFDLVISLATFHNLKLSELKVALSEMERVGKQGYLMLESYRNEREQTNLQCWALTAETLLDVNEWVWLYREFGYSGDYEFIYFEDV